MGSREGKIVCDRLVAESVDVPGNAVSCVLENLWYEGFIEAFPTIEGIPYRDRGGVPAREDRPIIGPKWHAELIRKLEGG